MGRVGHLPEAVAENCDRGSRSISHGHATGLQILRDVRGRQSLPDPAAAAVGHLPQWEETPRAT